MTSYPAPVTGRSRPVRSPRVAYSEVAGQPVLCHVDQAVVHVLDEAAVMLWVALDGRTLDEIAGAGARRDQVAVLVEAVRRLRALDLVDDAAGAAATRTSVPLDLAGTAARSIELRGEIGEAGSASVRVGPSFPESVVVTLDPQPGIRGEPQALREIVADAVGATADAAPPGRLDPVAALRVLVGACAAHALGAPNAVDALAELAERVPVAVTAEPAGARGPG